MFHGLGIVSGSSVVWKSVSEPVPASFSGKPEPLPRPLNPEPFFS